MRICVHLAFTSALLQYCSFTNGVLSETQGVLQQLVTMGAVNNLPEEAQWNIRVLLPRKTETAVAPLAVPIARAAVPAPGPAPTDPASATSYLLSMLMHHRNQMAAPAQQVPNPCMSSSPHSAIVLAYSVSLCCACPKVIFIENKSNNDDPHCNRVRPDWTLLSCCSRPRSRSSCRLSRTSCCRPCRCSTCSRLPSPQVTLTSSQDQLMSRFTILAA